MRSIGLVLGGGGARGFAHLGVLRAMEEAGLEPDFIFGCSMGGLVGALAACGFDAAKIDEIVDECLTPKLLATGRNGSFLGSRGIARLLSRHVCERFEQLDIPFAVTTVDVQCGELVVLDQGELLPALRATIAIPGILPAIRVDDRLLVDGGLLNNLPIDLIRKRSRSPIVAVEVGEPHDRPLDIERPTLWNQLESLLRPGRRPVTIDLLMKAFLIPQSVLTRARLESSPPDVLIRPRLGKDFLMEDFARKDEAVEAGYRAAREALRGQVFEARAVEE